MTGRQVRDRPDDELLAGAAQGEWAAWDEIISRYTGLVIHAATRIGLSRSDAADVAQVTWLRLWKYGHRIRDPKRLAGWLACTARREASRLAAASSRHVLCADPLGEQSGSHPAVASDTYPVELEYDWAIEQALSRLPALYRTLLRLLSSDLDLSYSEVATRMGLPRGSIGPMRIRAIQMLEKTPEFTSGRFPRPRVTDTVS